jgi:membrane-bound inhibitor of C-type lysozyme
MSQIPAVMNAAIALASAALLATPAFSQKPNSKPTSSDKPTTETAPTTKPAAPAPSSTEATPTPQSDYKVINKVQYKCDEGKGFLAEYRSNSTVQAIFGSKVLTLPQVESASGIRYSDGSVTLYSKGEGAFVDVGDKRLFNNCVVQKSPLEGRW